MLMRPDPGKQPSFPALVTVAVTSPADVMKCPDKKHKRGKRGLVHSLMMLSILEGKSEQQESKVAGHAQRTIAPSEGRVMDAAAQPTFSFVFSSGALEWYFPQLRWLIPP